MPAAAVYWAELARKNRTIVMSPGEACLRLHAPPAPARKRALFMRSSRSV